MLHLLQPNIPNRNVFLLQLIAVSALFHLGFGIMLLYVQTEQQLYHVVFNNSPIDLVDMIVSPCASAAQLPASSPSKQSERKSITNLAPIVPVPKKEPIITPAPKKMEAKKGDPAKKVERKGAMPTPAQKKEVATQPPLQPSQSKPIHQQQKVVTQKEYDALALQQLVQEELQHYWQPPSGLSKDLLCEMAIELDGQGSVKQLACVRSSGVLVYDIHAQSVLLQVCYPKETWGKQLTIMFKQT